MRKYKIQPLRALKAIKLIAQSKGNTQGYVEINIALNGSQYEKVIEEWCKTSQGKRYLNGERLPLDKKFKKGTVGAVRQEFLGADLKSSNITDLDMPVRSSEIAYGLWILDMHDISHIMTDYGQDGLGELFRIEFEINQVYQRGFQVISWLFQLKMLSISYKHFRQVRRMIKEAQQRAKACDDIYMIDWFEYLDKPYEWVKETVAKVPPVKLYNINDKKMRQWADKHF